MGCCAYGKKVGDVSVRPPATTVPRARSWPSAPSHLHAQGYFQARQHARACPSSFDEREPTPVPPPGGACWLPRDGRPADARAAAMFECIKKRAVRVCEHAQPRVLRYRGTQLALLANRRSALAAEWVLAHDIAVCIAVHALVWECACADLVFSHTAQRQLSIDSPLRVIQLQTCTYTLIQHIADVLHAFSATGCPRLTHIAFVCVLASARRAGVLTASDANITGAWSNVRIVLHACAWIAIAVARDTPISANVFATYVRSERRCLARAAADILHILDWRVLCDDVAIESALRNCAYSMSSIDDDAAAGITAAFACALYAC